MQSVRILLYIVIFGIILNGISQAFITYAVVPNKYEQKDYSFEEVKAIAYSERSKGVKFLYENSYVNGLTFAVLGVLIGTDLFLQFISKKSQKNSNPCIIRGS